MCNLDALSECELLKADATTQHFDAILAKSISMYADPCLEGHSCHCGYM